MLSLSKHEVAALHLRAWTGTLRQCVATKQTARRFPSGPLLRL